MVDSEPLKPLDRSVLVRTKFTLQVEPVNATWAASLATKYLRDYPENQCYGRLDRHGVIFTRSDKVTFYVFGNNEHVRVKQYD